MRRGTMKKERSEIMKRVTVLIIVAMAAITAATAQSIYPTDMTFQSTSAMRGSGSTYSSSPMLDAEGLATNEKTSEVTEANSGPRRIRPTIPEGNPTPIGDALLPLLLMAVGYAVLLYRKRRANAPTPDNL